VLGRDYSVSRVEIHNREDCCQDRINGAKVGTGIGCDNCGAKVVSDENSRNYAPPALTLLPLTPLLPPCPTPSCPHP